MVSYTKQIIVNAFEQLLLEKPFNDITVSDIIKQSDVSRSTFYQHFSDKYELFTWNYLQVLNSIHTEDKGVEDWREVIHASMSYIDQHRDYYSKIIAYQGQNSFEEFLYNYAMEYCTRIMCRYKQIDELPNIDYQALRIYMKGIIWHVAEWIKKKDLSVDELTELQCRVRPPILSDYFK